MRFGLIGCGNFGVELGKYLLEVGEIVAVCDVLRERAEATAKALGLEASVHTDFRELIDQQSLDAVAITAANFVHCQVACAAAACRSARVLREGHGYQPRGVLGNGADGPAAQRQIDGGSQTSPAPSPGHG